MHLVSLLVLAFVPFCISRAFNDEPPVDGADDERTNKLVNGQVYGVDDEIPETVDSEDTTVDEVGDEEGPKKEEQPRNVPDSFEDSILEDEVKSMINGQNSAPEQEYQDPPVDGEDKEGLKKEEQPRNVPDSFEDSVLEDEVKSMINGQNSAPEQEYQDPPVDGEDKEGLKKEEQLRNVPESYEDSILEDDGKSMINGQNSAPEQEFQDPPVDGEDEKPRNVPDSKIQTFKRALVEMDSPSVWRKYNPFITSWCTTSGRTLISYHISCIECQTRCRNKPGCIAVEYWEEYNDACFECTDLRKITPYTNANDLAFPVYVWIPEWLKYQSSTSWCTVYGRRILSYYISLAECQSRCDNKPGCNAVEYWEKYNDACFECTDTTKITAYTNQYDLAYPVYVWIHVWKKHTSYTSWCTTSGRAIIRYHVDRIKCQKLCQARSGCKAIEYWEKYNDACFQCTDTSKITAYTNIYDLAYPVYVWVAKP